jgi:alanyl-tRNA synthetase
MNIKDKYIEYFIKQDHKKLNSSPIIPENDPTSLFNTAGMQPLVPYLMGQPHPLGKRLVNYQKCFRLTDLEAIGDKTHHTFFEMLGNWSLGDYFKEESLKWSFEFLTKELNIPVSQLAVTVFRGNDFVPKDDESANIWLKLGIKASRIAYLGEKDNWWGPAGEVGPCGPDSEIFYWNSKEVAPDQFDPEDSRWLEIWNNVFMQYNKKEDGSFIPLTQKNVDTGMGVERMTSVLEGVNDNYESSIWKPVINKIEEISNLKYEHEAIKRSMRIVADHIRAIVIISGDDAQIRPSNTDQGYILRRLIRRMLRYAKKLEIDITSDFALSLAEIVIDMYKNNYQELARNKETILKVIKEEQVKFSRTLEKGLKEFEKIVNNLNVKVIDGEKAFHLYDTYGFPIELTVELAEEKGFTVDVEGFNDKFKEHQDKSRLGAEQKFKGGLSSTNDINVKYHTATHLLNAALKVVLGDQIHQMGSNINDERLRFDFPHHTKLTDDELKKVEDLVNSYIARSIPVVKKEMTKEEALTIGAEAAFIERYGDVVSVYFIEDISKEFCGGPHVNNTSELGTFKIIKEEASSAGVRRIKAILL